MSLSDARKDADREFGMKEVGSTVQPCQVETVNPNAGTEARGNRIDIVFDPSKSKKVKKCSAIAHVQVIQMFIDNKHVKPSEYHSGFAYRDDTALDDGSYVDQLPRMSSPDPQSIGIGTYGQKNGGSTNTTFFDVPRDGRNNLFYDPKANPKGWKKVVWRFETFAWCKQGDDCGTWYEGVRWKYVKTWKDAQKGLDGNSIITSKKANKPSKTFIAAFDKFNSARGYSPCS